jgi:hypothetical protein
MGKSSAVQFAIDRNDVVGDSRSAHARMTSSKLVFTRISNLFWRMSRFTFFGTWKPSIGITHRRSGLRH